MLKFVSKIIVEIIFRIIFRLKVIGRKNMPNSACIIAANHFHALDPLIVGCVVPFRVNLAYMAKAELFKNPFISCLLKKFDVFPVERSKTSSAALALRQAIRIIKLGKTLGIFPEGTRNNRNNQIQTFNKGAALVAIKTNVLIVPTVIISTRKLFFLSKIKVVFGKPIDSKKYSKDEQGVVNLTKELYNSILNLLEQHK